MKSAPDKHGKLRLNAVKRLCVDGFLRSGSITNAGKHFLGTVANQDFGRGVRFRVQFSLFAVGGLRRLSPRAATGLLPETAGCVWVPTAGETNLRWPRSDDLSLRLLVADDDRQIGALKHREPLCSACEKCKTLTLPACAIAVLFGSFVVSTILTAYSRQQIEHC